LARDNFLLDLDEGAAVAAPAKEEVGKGITLECVGLTDFHTLEEVENPSKTAAVGTSIHETVLIEAVISSECRIASTGDNLSVNEARAESCFQAEVICTSEAVPNIISPLFSTCLLTIFLEQRLRLSSRLLGGSRLLSDGLFYALHDDGDECGYGMLKL